MTTQLKTFRWSLYFDDLTPKAQKYLLKRFKELRHLPDKKTLKPDYDLGEIDIVVDPTDFEGV
jgi:hypothetical protein